MKAQITEKKLPTGVVTRLVSKNGKTTVDVVKWKKIFTKN